jgi:hypothetical protein
MASADDRARYLAALFPRQLGRIEFRPLPSGEHLWVAHRDLAGVEQAVREIAWRRENLYVGVAARGPENNGTFENLIALEVGFADCDWKTTPEAEVRKRLGEFPFIPTMVVNTGGGIHPYWGLLDPLMLPEDAPVARRLLRGLALKFGGDLEVGEPTRILRIPGTPNYKYDPPRLVWLESCHPERRYLVDDLLQFLPEEEAAPPGQSFVVPESIAPGSRHGTLYKLARSLKLKGFAQAEVLAAVRIANERGTPPLDDAEVVRQVDKAMRRADRPRLTSETDEPPARTDAEFESARATELVPFDPPASTAWKTFR